MFRQEKIVLILMSILYVIIGYTTERPTIQSLSMMGWFGLVQLFYCVISWIKRGNQFISPYMIFLFCLYIFSYGQSFLWAFGLESERTLLGFHDITESDIFGAQVQALIMLAFFHIGATYWFLKSKRTSISNDDRSYDYTRPLKQIGWVLFLISVVPYASTLITNAILSATKGYGAIYEGEATIGLNNLKAIIADYCIPSVICLYIAYKDNRFVRNLITVFLLLNVVVIMIIGGRTNAVILLALLIVMYNYLVKRFTKKWLFAGVFGAFLLLQVLAFVANTRVEGFNSARKEGFKVENKAAVDAIAEMGGTMFCQIKTMELVPEEEPYRYGKSYLYSFTTIIPNLNFWAIHPAKKESNLSDWLTDKLGLDYGTGFSMCAEAYANFGYFGFIVFFFWGWFLASIFGKIEISAQTRNYALMAFLLILFWFFLKIPRNNFINIVRPIFFIAGPIYLYCTKLAKRQYDTN